VSEPVAAEPSEQPTAVHGSAASRPRGLFRRKHVVPYEEERLLEHALAGLNLDAQITGYIRGRCLSYLRWLDNGAVSNRRLYYWLRIPALILAAAVPALVAADFGATGRAITVALGIVVAATTAVEHFLNSGERWRHYRSTVELTKSELWLFLELAEQYSHWTTHEAAFPTFVARAERLVQAEARQYVATIVAEQRPAGGGGDAATGAHDGAGKQPEAEKPAQ
jgi:hypothetical protein